MNLGFAAYESVCSLIPVQRLPGIMSASS